MIRTRRNSVIHLAGFSCTVVEGHSAKGPKQYYMKDQGVLRYRRGGTLVKTKRGIRAPPQLTC